MAMWHFGIELPHPKSLYIPQIRYEFSLLNPVKLEKPLLAWRDLNGSQEVDAGFALQRIDSKQWC